MTTTVVYSLLSQIHVLTNLNALLIPVIPLLDARVRPITTFVTMVWLAQLICALDGVETLGDADMSLLMPLVLMLLRVPRVDASDRQEIATVAITPPSILRATTVSVAPPISAM